MLKKTIAVTAMTAALVGGVLVTPGLAAGKGGGKGNTTAATTSTIELVQENVALGDLVDFKVTYPTTYKYPRVQVQCWVGADLAWATANPAGVAFKLGGDWSPWLDSGNDAACQADLYNLVQNGGNAPQVTMLASFVFAARGRVG